MSEAGADYVTSSKSVHTDVCLPTVDHSKFGSDRAAQHALLALLYEKLAIEHRASNHALFLELDPERKGVISPTAFRSALAGLGVPLTDGQLEWLVNRFDCSKDGGIDFGEFVKMLSACRMGEVAEAGGGRAAAAPPAKTGLEWAMEQPPVSPYKAADDAREARKRLVLQHYAETLHKASLAQVLTSSPKSTQTTADVGTETETEAVVQAVLRRLAGVALEKLGGLKKAFGHADGDGDHAVGREDLAHCLEHHLGLALPEPEFDALFLALDFEGTGAVHYHEWIRVLSHFAEETEAGAHPQRWCPTANATVLLQARAATTTAAAATDSTAAAAEEPAPAPMEDVADETAGLGYGEEEAAVRQADDAVLRRAAEAVRERGLHAHGLIKQLLPESGGKADAAGLRALFAKLGVEGVDEARARRFLARGDLMGNGALVSWELVRLLASATKAAE